MYIPQTIIDDVMEAIYFSGTTFVCNKDVADYFAEQGYNVQKSEVGFIHWDISEKK